ncbi:MAG: putative peptide transporter permease protein [Dactylosporangium sp.]|nr:putative peptide transporter permease protein [Dactylosporangium sp.]
MQDLGQRAMAERQLVGGRCASIIVALCATAFVVVLGGLVGMAAGFYGGWVDSVLSRFTDIFCSANCCASGGWAWY